MTRTLKTTLGQVGHTLIDQGVAPSAVGNMIQTLGQLPASARLLVTLNDAGNVIQGYKLTSRGYGKPAPKPDYGPKLPKLTPTQAALITEEIFAIAQSIARRPLYRRYVEWLGGEQGVDDVLQEAVYLKVAKFDPNKGVPFEAFLRHPLNGIGGSLRDAVRKLRVLKVSAAPPEFGCRQPPTPYEMAVQAEEGVAPPPMRIQPERQRPRPRTWPKAKFRSRRVAIPA